MREYKAIQYAPYKETLLDICMPEGECTDLFIYLHGGGIEEGSRDQYPKIFETLADKGIGSVTVDYRMYPDAKYPEFVENCAAACAWVRDHIAEYGGCKRMFLGGSSAGGYLSMMLCFDKRWLNAVGMDPMDFAGYIHDAGQPTKHFNVLREHGQNTKKIIVDETAPLYFIGDAPEYPPMYFIVSDNDIKNRYEQTQLVLSTLRHFGYDQSKIKYTLMPGKHCFAMKNQNEQGENILGKMVAEFILETK